MAIQSLNKVIGKGKVLPLLVVASALPAWACGPSVSHGDQDAQGLVPADAGPDAPPPPPPEPVSSLTLEQVWYLNNGAGNHALIDFRVTPPSVRCNTNVGASAGFEGTGVFTEPMSGDLLFYTDGITVFSGKTNAALDNGTGLNGDPSASEPALIAPKYHTQNLGFYVFTNNTNDVSSSSVYYSVIDLSMGPNGTVTSKNVVLLTGNPGEALDLLPNTDGKGYWVVVYDGAGTVKSFPVDEQGVHTTPVVSSTGFTGAVYRSSINHTLDYDTLSLAYVKSATAGDGVIAVASINRTTGVVSNASVIATGDLGYHATFSPDGTKVYYVRGTQGWSGQAYQYDRTAQHEQLLGGSALGASKLAIDGKIYWAGYNIDHLAVVNSPNAAGVAADFHDTGLMLGGCKAGFGVPNQTAAYIEYLIGRPAGPAEQ